MSDPLVDDWDHSHPLDYLDVDTIAFWSNLRFDW